MAKIGRNDKCPCQSGKKYKHCCARLQRAPKPMSDEEKREVTLTGAVTAIQQDASQGRIVCRELGVFFLFATKEGDAWVMEMTDCDCIKVAEGQKAIDGLIVENPETIEINWTHTYSIREKQVELVAYQDKKISILEFAPSRELHAAMRRIRKKFSSDELAKVHLAAEEV